MPKPVMVRDSSKKRISLDEFLLVLCLAVLMTALFCLFAYFEWYVIAIPFLLLAIMSGSQIIDEIAIFLGVLPEEWR